MFEPAALPRLFALPPGADFAAELVAGLVDRMAGQPPEALARVELYLNTARMQRAVRAAFDARGARLLPRLRLVTDLGRDPLAGLPAAVPPLRRRLELAQLVARLTRAQPDFAPGTAVYDLADSLADLMDEMQGEGVTPAALEALDTGDHAAHWQRSLAFIRIVSRYFDGSEAPDPEARQRRVVEALAARWQAAPPAHPVIVAGSTGSRGATALFLQAVARLPQGAVVLPGLDRAMPAAAWDSLEAGEVPAEDHPQYRFLALARALGLEPGQIADWTAATPPCPTRNRLVSLALRPAPVTDQWLTEGAALGELGAATAAVTLIEAPDPRAEALAVALRLRQAAEAGQSAALVTPDRMLTRRVAAALDRWGIVADDSAGLPLLLSAPGRFLRHVAALFGRPLTVEALLILLKHPLTATGAGTRGDHLRFTRELELQLRRHGPAFPDAAALAAWAAKGPEDGRAAWAQWLGDSLSGRAEGADRPLSAWTETHLALAEALAAGPGGTPEASELWQAEAGRSARRIFDELCREAGHGGAFAAHDYADLVAALLDAGSVRQPEGAHPGIRILGTLEARAGGADLVILGGLTDGGWPELPPPDPWLSRRMRLDAGLLLPERRVGLAAHDFQQAIAAPEVVLSRALRDAEAETVASRWLNRLTNLMGGLPAQGGPAALAAMRARGAALVATALQLEEPAAPLPRAPRPAPCPPVAHRPRELPVTGIRTLIRDPYAVYARRILRLSPLDPILATPDARLRGQAIHRIVERFVRERPEGEAPGAARTRLAATAEAVLTEEIAWPSARRLWLARLMRVADAFLAAEVTRAARGRPVVIEKKGSVTLQNPVFTLTATPDRIDLLADGLVHLYDYKTGEPPSQEKQKHFEKQLLLEAAMAERGGFAELGPRRVEGVTYIGLGASAKEVVTLIEGEILTETWAGLGRLLARYLTRAQGFAARRAMFESRDISDYDHLSRYGEWGLGDASIPERVGPEEEP